MLPLKRSLRPLLALIAALSLLAIASTAQAGGFVFTVTSTADTGGTTCTATCTLREAIGAANLAPSGNAVIRFALPNCPTTPAACVISPASSLPTVTRAGLVFDGSSQPGYSGTAIVVVDGASAGGANGLDLNADDITIHALAVRAFNGSGVVLNANPLFTFTDNVVTGNASFGINVGVGGINSNLDVEGNTITGNGSGGVNAIYVTAVEATFANNNISNNTSDGIEVAVSGTLTFTGNTVSGNTGSGIYSQFTTTDTATFTNNHVNNNSSRGIAISDNNVLTFTGNEINNNPDGGVQAQSSTSKTATFTNNTINNDAAFGVIIANSQTLNFNGNTIDNSGHSGVIATAATTNTATFTNNHLDDNGDDAVQLAASNLVTFTGNTANGNAGAGFDSSQVDTATMNITNNQVNDNGWHGLAISPTTQVTISGNTITGNTAHGINTTFGIVANAVLAQNTISNNDMDGAFMVVSNNANVTGNTILSNGEDGLAVYGSGAPVPTLTLTGNDIGNNNGAAVDTAVSNTLEITGNNVHDNQGGGIFAGGTPTPTVSVLQNNFVANEQDGLSINGPAPAVHFNRFFLNENGLANAGSGAVDATDNWWGCNAGPGDPDCDTVSGPVTFDPWLVLSITADPASVQTGGTSNITGDVYHDSVATDTSGVGFIPDGIGVVFQADLGTVSAPAIKNTNGGKATTTFHAAASPGTAHVSATLDNQTVETDVVIGSGGTPAPTTPAPTPTGGAHLQGDLDCDGHVTAADGLIAFAFAAGFPHTGSSGCPDVGTPNGDHPFGDVNCDGVVDEADGLAILEFAAGTAIEPPQPEGCTALGA